MDVKVFLLLTSLAITRAAVLRNGVEIPQFAQVCRRSQDNFDDCLKNSLQTLIQKISKEGIPKLNFPPLDPWHTDEFHIKNSGDPFKIGLTFSNGNTYGFSTIEILGLRSKFDNPNQIMLDIDFRNKRIFINGNYVAEGYISDLPILGKGTFSSSLSNVTGTLKVRGHIVTKDKEEYLHIDRMIMTPAIGDLKLQMTNENNKYPEISNLLVSLMNQFWRPIYQEALPYFQHVTDEIMSTRLNLVTMKIPYNQLIPK